MSEKHFEELCVEIWAVENDAQNLYGSIGRLDYVLDQLADNKDLQGCGDDLAKLIRMRNACRDALLRVDEFTDEVSRIKEWCGKC